MTFNQYKSTEPFERRVHALDAYFKGEISKKYEWDYTTQKNLKSINIKECLSGLTIHYSDNKKLVFYVESGSNATRAVALLYVTEINSITTNKKKTLFLQEESNNFTDKKDGIYTMLLTIQTIIQHIQQQ